MIIYGLIAYIGIVVLIIGYLVAKKAGDQSQTNNYNDFQEE